MIKDNQKHFNALHVVLDICVIILSYVIAWNIQFRLVVPRHIGVLPMRIYMGYLLVVVPEFIILYYMFNLYAPKRVSGRRMEAGNIFMSNCMGLLLFIVLLYIQKQNNVSRKFMATFIVVNMILTVIERNLIRHLLHRIRTKGMNLKHILLVGCSKAAEGFIDRVIENPQWGYHINGILDDNHTPGYDYRGVSVIGKTCELEAILTENRQDALAITLGLKEYDKLKHIVATCEKSGVHTMFIPDYMNIIPTRPDTEDLIGLPVINIRHVPLSEPFNAALKRLMDIVGSIICMIIASPVMLAVAIAVKMSSPGPIFFSQVRVGLHNREFRMYKFRSMAVQSAAQEKKGWTTKDDPRVTKVGRFIRKTSIDELPQLWNVLKGEMSLVGPRPERPQFVEKFREEIPRYMIKHQVRPGMTGWAQVNGYRGNTSISKRIEHDLYYIENWTVGLDIKILFLTVFRGFVNKNAY